MEVAIVWFRNDLRVTDNPTLADAVTTADEIVPIYVVDSRERGETRYGTEKLGTHRARFRRESLLELRATLRERGGELFVRQGRPEAVVPDIAGRVGADAVYAQTKPATEELEVENAVREALPDEIAFERRWTHTLYHVSDLPTSHERMNDTFTPWRKAVERECPVREPVAPPTAVSTPDLSAGDVPTLSELGLETPPDDDRVVLAFEGGESAGKRRLEEYFWEGDHLREYKTTRNGMLGENYSSKFSPWLAAGCLSPRWIHAEVSRYEDERGHLLARLRTPVA